MLRWCSEQQPGNKDHCTWCALRPNCSNDAISSTPEGLLLAVALLRLCSEQQPGNEDHCTWCALRSNCSHRDLCSEQQATPHEAKHSCNLCLATAPKSACALSNRRHLRRSQMGRLCLSRSRFLTLAVCAFCVYTPLCGTRLSSSRSLQRPPASNYLTLEGRALMCARLYIKCASECD